MKQRAAPENRSSLRVSVVICTKNKGLLLDQLLRRLIQDCASLLDIIVVSNQTTNFFAKLTLERWALHPNVVVINYDKAFNFSEQCNIAAERARGELLLFLNDDIVPIVPFWLDYLIQALQPDVGAVGPLLLYPDEKVQHAGMHTGFYGTAGHTLRHARLPDEDYLFTGSCTREVSCVTGAVLLMRKSTFLDLNGFDIRFASIYQDVDLCLRIGNLGYRILFEPSAVLLHMESVSVRDMLKSNDAIAQQLRERELLSARYGADRLAHDPFLNPSFSPSDESLKTLAI